MTNSISSFALSVIVVTLLSGCGDTSSDAGPIPAPDQPGTFLSPPDRISYPAPTSTTLALRPAGSTTVFDAFMQSSTLRQEQSLENITVNSTDASLPATVSGMSTTNTVEDNVDEDDIVKQDAHYIYRLDPATYNAPAPTSSPLKIFDKLSGALLSTTSTGSNARGIYHMPGQLVTLGYAPATSPSENYDAMPVVWSYSPSTLEVKSFNITDVKNPTLDKTFSWPGTLLTSRRIDNKLYVISQYWFNSDQTDLPGSPAGVPDKKDCLLNDAYKHYRYNNSVIYISRIDLGGEAKPHVTCIASSDYKVYFSPKNLYLMQYTGSHDDTLVHKFTLKNVPIYERSGIIKGTPNIWSTNSDYAVSESGDTLRLITQLSDRSYRLTTMAPDIKDATLLTELAHIPNDTAPASIGKPNETIRGIRFTPEAAYIVTFMNTDPLYKINLKNPRNPYIAGDLEIPGFSAYLHPVNDQYMVGVGYSSATRGWSPSWPVDTSAGIRIALFDISRDTPEMADSVTVPFSSMGTPDLNAYSSFNLLPAYQPHTFSFIQTPDGLRFNFIGALYRYGGSGTASYTSTIAYEFDTHTSARKLNYLARTVSSSTSNWWDSSSNTRGLLDGNIVYYSQPGQENLMKKNWRVAD